MSYNSLALWFSPKGRMNRRPYFFAGLAVAAVIRGMDLVPQDYQLVYLPVALLALYVAIALGIKRAHDRDRSGFFVLVLFIPILNLWPLVELTFLKGTEGTNRFGEDPLQSPPP